MLFEIRPKLEKDEKHRNVKILTDVSIVAASGMATFFLPKSLLDSVF